MNLREQRFGSALMRDLETGSIWVQATGEAIEGPLAGSRLALLGVEITSLSRWQENHPETTVYGTVHGPDTAAERVLWEPGRAKFIALAVKTPQGVRAYCFQDIVDAGGVLEDVIGDRPIAVVYEAGAYAMAAFDRRTEHGIAHLRLDRRPGAVLWVLADLFDAPLDRRTGRVLRDSDPNAGEAEDLPGLEPLAFHPILLDRFRVHYPEGTVYSPPDRAPR